ncbi:MAG: helix-turn-helix domain-containing protein [Oscillospiraceae bacterium]|nr:helix-turn-helix domain-containing protein [Oscillospiraceae bacterium]
MDRDFKGIWIPREVWLDDRLGALDKVILAEVDSLDTGPDGCFATNEHLAEFCGCTTRTVTSAIAKLIECGYLEVVAFTGRARKLRSLLTKPFPGSIENFSMQSGKNFQADTKNFPGSTIKRKINSNTNRFIPPSIQEVSEYCRERGNSVDPERFIDFYSAKGWKIGKNTMTDWKAAVRTWEKRDGKKPTRRNDAVDDDFDKVFGGT